MNDIEIMFNNNKYLRIFNPALGEEMGSSTPGVWGYLKEI